MTHHLQAVLVRFSLCGVWDGKITDRQITDEVHSTHQLSTDSGEYKKKLFPESACGRDNAHKRWISACAGMYGSHRDHTGPWESPLRVLKASYQPQYDLDIAALWSAAQAAGEQFFAAYASLQQRARTALNGQWRASDYPPVEKLQARFGFSLQYLPIPESSHFLDVLAGDAIARARAELNVSNERRVHEAQADALKRILEPFEKFVAAVSDPHARFKDSLVQNCLEMAGRAEALNLTGDAGLTATATALRQFMAGVSADALRDNTSFRKQMGDAGAVLLHQFGQLGARKFAA